MKDVSASTRINIYVHKNLYEKYLTSTKFRSDDHSMVKSAVTDENSAWCIFCETPTVERIVKFIKQRITSFQPQIQDTVIRNRKKKSADKVEKGIRNLGETSGAHCIYMYTRRWNSHELAPAKTADLIRSLTCSLDGLSGSFRRHTSLRQLGWVCIAERANSLSLFGYVVQIFWKKKF